MNCIRPRLQILKEILQILFTIIGSTCSQACLVTLSLPVQQDLCSLWWPYAPHNALLNLPTIEFPVKMQTEFWARIGMECTGMKHWLCQMNAIMHLWWTLSGRVRLHAKASLSFEDLQLSFHPTQLWYGFWAQWDLWADCRGFVAAGLGEPALDIEREHRQLVKVAAMLFSPILESRYVTARLDEARIILSKQ